MKISTLIYSVKPKCYLLVLLIFSSFFILTEFNSIQAGKTFDQVYFHLLSKIFSQKSSHQVISINIDNKTVNEIGREAFLHDSHIQLLKRLDGAASIAFDMHNLAKTPGSFTSSSFIEAAKKNGRVVLPLISEYSDAHQKHSTSASIKNEINHDISFALRDLIINTFGTVDSIVAYRNINGEQINHISLETIKIAKNKYFSFNKESDLSLENILKKPFLFMPFKQNDIKKYSYTDVLNDRIPVSSYDKKIIYIGSNIFDSVGAYRISPFNTDAISRPELNALITQAILNGNVVRKIPANISLCISIFICIVLIFICVFKFDKKSRFLVPGWIAISILFPMTIFASTQFWMPIGNTLLVCTLIYAFFLWKKSRQLHNLLRKELQILKQLSHKIGGNTHQIPHSISQNDGQLDDEMDTAISQIKAWHESYITVINLLPYPIFLENDRKIVLWNNSATLMMKTIGETEKSPISLSINGIPDITCLHHLIQKNEKEEKTKDVEITINNQQYLVLNTSLTSSALNNVNESKLNLICLINLQYQKDAILLDQNALRYMAHDLRTPLSTILALIEEQTTQETLNPTFIKDIRHQVDYSLRISQGIMQISRAEHLDPHSFTPVLLSDTINEAIEHVRLIAKKKLISKIEFTQIGEDKFVLGNRDMLLRALINLLDNSIKYSQNAQPIKIEMNSEVHANIKIVFIKIIDKGIGIPGDLIKHLFEPFFQIKKYAINPTDGVGLGLPFVKAVISKHQGNIQVTSSTDGTEMCVSLPFIAIDTFN